MPVKGLRPVPAATLAGFELYTEYDANEWLTPFATLIYVEGRDHTRDGDFATLRATPGVPSQQVPGLQRGAFSGVPGADNTVINIVDNTPPVAPTTPDLDSGSDSGDSTTDKSGASSETA